MKANPVQIGQDQRSRLTIEVEAEASLCAARMRGRSLQERRWLLKSVQLKLLGQLRVGG